MRFINSQKQMSKMPKIVEYCLLKKIKTTEFLKYSIYSLQSSIFNHTAYFYGHAEVEHVAGSGLSL